MPNIYDEIKKRILVLDGAMGTMIQQYKLQEDDYRGERFKDYHMFIKGNNDLLSITKPEIIQEIHRKYLAAGADIIETNTFNANRTSMADYNMENLVTEMNRASVKLAREVADEYTQKNPKKPRFVCGSIGPLNKTASMSPDVNDPGYRAVTFDDLVDVYTEQVRALIDAGVDILMVETIFDTLNAKCALYAIENCFEEKGVKLPVMVSGTITDASGRTLSGQTLEAFLTSVSHIELFSIGLNCSLGALELTPYVKELSEKSPFYVSAHPNAGLPNQFGEYDQTPEIMGKLIEGYLKNNFVNIIGGCCGTTDHHIAIIAKLAEKYSFRPVINIDIKTRLSGLEPLTVSKETNFVNIGERANVAGSRKFARLIREKKYEEALTIVRDQVEGGAQILDVNMDDGMLDAKHEMVTFLNLMVAEPEIAKLPIMVDSSKWDVIEAGLKCIQGKTIVNSLSLKEGEDKFIEHAKKVKRYGAAVVVMAFDEQGQADSYLRRIEICKRAYDILVNIVKYNPADIIFDPNILTVATGIEEHNNYAVDFFKATTWIKQNLPHAKVSGGVSNVSFSFRGNNTVREAMHSAFLYHAIKAGLDMGIVNPSMLQIYDDIPKDLLQLVEDVILNRHPDATEKLIDFAETVKDQKSAVKKTEEWREKPLEERLNHALIKGIADYLDSDLDEARKKYDYSIQIIEGPLMDGMNIVGELFGDGKMFLPQVVKTARVMKKAVSILLPYIEAEKTEASPSSAGKVLMATVKGDVHDIGKNIVGVVMACNNYEVIDMGVMVPEEEIIKKAIEINADIIGLSGLITPSLDEMVSIAQTMEKRGMKTPLLIGGATTSRIHTAVKLDPEYSGSVVHVIDASKSVGVLQNLLGTKKDEYKKNIKDEYAKLRNTYANREIKPFLSLEEARKNNLKIEFNSTTITKPEKTGRFEFIDYNLAEIAEYIDWSFFFHAWEMKGLYPDILNDTKQGKEARKLFNDAQAMLKRIIEEKMLQANAVVGIYPANSSIDDIELYTDESRTKIKETLYHLRQQTQKGNNIPNACLSDYIAPKGTTDYIGAFACTAGIGIDKWVKQFEEDNDDYSSIMIKVLADRLAEAFTELIHLKVRKELWGFAKNENLSLKELLKEKYQGIRPAYGYPACPEHSEKERLFKLLDANKIGISLTEHYAMLPTAAVSGLIFAHPQAKYFAVAKINKDQMKDYAQRKGSDAKTIEKLILPNIGYER